MRVIGGSAKGKTLKSPRGNKVRPTSDKLKAAFFNIVAESIVNAKFLDLFAGTGSMGIEALSRGAKRCVFVEKNLSTMQLLQENLRSTSMLSRAETLRCDYHLALRMLAKRQEAFDLIYIDPPYFYGGVTKILLLLEKNKLLTLGGIVAIERNSRWRDGSGDGGPDFPFLLEKEKIYGNSLLQLYKNK
ncbi:MAG: 16S rRNA (guanine(966)-N(2))-methyltransferase RsmD [Dethiobacteria bacterium]|jgi:16S rRNA (guanine966-N2)-methyltransferase